MTTDFPRLMALAAITCCAGTQKVAAQETMRSALQDAEESEIPTAVTAPIPNPAARATLQAQTDTTATGNDPERKRKGIGRKILDYLRNSNKQREDKALDFGFIPGPNYSATSGLGLGLLGTATYSADRSDRKLPRSNASVYSNMTTGGYFLIGLRGNHIFPHERYRLDYKVNLSTFSTKFWGIGYDSADRDANEAKYRRNRITAMARFMFKLAPKMYAGPFVNYRLVAAREVKDENAALWQGQDRTIRAYTAGVSVTYDSRDFMLNATRGVFVQADQTFTPRCFGNGKYNFSSTEVTFCAYGKLWRGAVLAGELHAQFNYGHTPWALLSEIGTNDRMRGYYEGRYRDNNLIEGQIELRQHIKGRNGIAVWAGLGNVFPHFGRIAWRKTLPNAGVGYRWEFKKGINIRIDYGLTRNGGGFIFNIGEAF
jgi:outer membrane protein assembly factor BamA